MSRPAPARADALAHAAHVLGSLARRDEPLGARTTYRVGGSAALLVELAGEAELEVVARAVAESGVEVLIVGNGSNLLVADGGFPGLAVVLGGSFATLRLDRAGSRAVAGGACSYPVLARRTTAAGLSGLEWAVGIPGTVGGAVRMNAGGHGASTHERLTSARVVDLVTGRDRVAAVADLAFGYRRSSIGAGEIVLEATFQCEPGDPARGSAELASIVAWRRANQPGGHNAGSVFTNPPGDSAGRLVEACGLKGRRVGSAAVSSRHANFIQADTGGSADDVLALVDLVRAEVERRTGIRLETELRVVGASW